MPSKICAGCGRVFVPQRDEGRCPKCPLPVRQRAPRPTTAGRTWGERKRRAEVVAAHRAQFGDWCPGWQVPPHATADLTADHPIAIAAGGRQDAQLQVLCRPCNARKAHHGPGGHPSAV
jgi:5-methylcytosine-specific restriction protein A